LCSHCMHPEVIGTGARGLLQSRQLLGALCDLGRSEVSQPIRCHAGGHPCWERIVEQEVEALAVPSALTLPEAFDFLDTCWRLAFGKKQALLRLRNVTGTVMLSLPCATRDEFNTRLSALADMFKSMDVPDELLPKERRQIAKDQTFSRLLACL